MAVACAFDFACAYQVAEVYECLGQLDNAILWAQVSALKAAKRQSSSGGLHSFATKGASL